MKDELCAYEHNGFCMKVLAGTPCEIEGCVARCSEQDVLTHQMTKTSDQVGLAMTDMDANAKNSTAATQDETSEEILAKMRGEEKVICVGVGKPQKAKGVLGEMIKRDFLEEIIAHIKGIEYHAERMTSANYMHNTRAIIGSAQIIQERIGHLTSLPSDTTSDDLEEEIRMVAGDFEQVRVSWNSDFDFIARHFAEWGKKHAGIENKSQSPASNDFEEEWSEYFRYKGSVATVNIKDLARHFANWQLERIVKALLSEVLPCFMHGGESDELVAKLDEVLNNH